MGISNAWWSGRQPTPKNIKGEIIYFIDIHIKREFVYLLHFLHIVKKDFRQNVTIANMFSQFL